MENKDILSDVELDGVAGGAGRTGKTYIPYKIVRGDTLSGIAVRFHTTVDELVRINHIVDRNKIYAGDTIFVPKVR